MRTIIAGCRNFYDFSVFSKLIKTVPWKITQVVCGCAIGADTLGEHWGKITKIPISYFLADWEKYGRKAGVIRNKQMAENAEALVAFWDDSSPGTRNMIKQASETGLQIKVFKI